MELLGNAEQLIMKFPYAKSERRTARVLKQARIAKTASAIARTIASCRHDFGANGREALCRICGCIRPRPRQPRK